MSTEIHPAVEINKLNEIQRKVCASCPVMINQDGRANPFCNLARFERILGRIPTYKDAEVAHICTGCIPTNCPNGYLNPFIREVR